MMLLVVVGYGGGEGQMTMASKPISNGTQGWPATTCASYRVAAGRVVEIETYCELRANRNYSIHRRGNDKLNALGIYHRGERIGRRERESHLGKWRKIF